MLLQFRIKNYRSIRDEVVLSLLASTDKELAHTNLMPTGLKALSHVVRSAVIYGPNASGKSNVLQALAFMRGVVAESATIMQLGQTFNVQPFRLDAEVSKQPTEFEITFVHGGVRHQYGFSLTPERVMDEWLLVYRTAKPQQWFSRKFDEKSQSYTYEFGSHLTGPRKIWQESTRPNALFLATAAQLNSELLGPVFTWIVDKLMFFAAGTAPMPDYTTELLKNATGKQAVRDFMASADTGISDIEAVSRKGIHQQIVMSSGGPAQISREERELLMPQFVHETERGSARFELHEESLGTQRLYALAAPVLDVLENGRVLIVDELDSSLHTLLVRRLVGMFHNPALNPRGAQLIFSTHDTSLLDQALFRRDQVWFTEKNREQSTLLYPLTDFSPRKKEALERGYLAGRYGAVPFFSEPVTETPPAQVGA
jgi:AAA15 family ATPase/GTPase